MATAGVNGMIRAASYALQNNVPYLGICLGDANLDNRFSARLNGFEVAHSKEFAPRGKQLVITYLKGQKSLQNTGGTMPFR